MGPLTFTSGAADASLGRSSKSLNFSEGCSCSDLPGQAGKCAFRQSKQHDPQNIGRCAQSIGESTINRAATASEKSPEFHRGYCVKKVRNTGFQVVGPLLPPRPVRIFDPSLDGAFLLEVLRWALQGQTCAGAVSVQHGLDVPLAQLGCAGR